MSSQLGSSRRFRFGALIISLCSLLMFFASPVYSDWDGDIDDITQELDRDFKFGGKEEIKAENLEQANTQLREDIQIGQSVSNLSGTYTFPVPFGPLMGTILVFQYHISELGNFTATGAVPGLNTFSFVLAGTITGNSTTFRITRIQVPGAPTNFVACTESVTVTGVISGSGEAGTTHSFSRKALCSEPQGPAVVHTKQ